MRKRLDIITEIEREKKIMKFTLNGNVLLSLPSDKELIDAITSLKPNRDSFAILGSESEFLQCCVNKKGKTFLEWRTPEGFYRAQANGLTIDKVAAAFVGYKNQIDGWPDDIKWARVKGVAVSIPRIYSYIEFIPPGVGILLMIFSNFVQAKGAQLLLQRIASLMFSIFFLMANIIALKTGVLIGRGGSVSVDDSPTLFWFGFSCFCIMFLSLVYLALW